jgi:hypothetical protein
MSIGSSGRLVIEIDPELKRRLHSALAMDGLTLKQWLVLQADAYLAAVSQMKLSLEPETNVSSSVAASSGQKHS